MKITSSEFTVVGAVDRVTAFEARVAQTEAGAFRAIARIDGFVGFSDDVTTVDEAVRQAVEDAMASAQAKR